jgi:hypothetical protein
MATPLGRTRACSGEPTGETLLPVCPKVSLIAFFIQLSRNLAKACCEMSRRIGAIIGWHEVPGTASAQKSHSVGQGVIHAGLRSDPMI